MDLIAEIGISLEYVPIHPSRKCLGTLGMHTLGMHYDFNYYTLGKAKVVLPLFWRHLWQVLCFKNHFCVHVNGDVDFDKLVHENKFNKILWLVFPKLVSDAVFTILTTDYCKSKWHAVSFFHYICFSLLLRDAETVLKKVREIGELIATIDVLAMEAEVGMSILYVTILVQS